MEGSRLFLVGYDLPLHVRLLLVLLVREILGIEVPGPVIPRVCILLRVCQSPCLSQRWHCLKTRPCAGIVEKSLQTTSGWNFAAMAGSVVAAATLAARCECSLTTPDTIESLAFQQERNHFVPPHCCGCVKKEKPRCIFRRQNGCSCSLFSELSQTRHVPRYVLAALHIFFTGFGSPFVHSRLLELSLTQAALISNTHMFAISGPCDRCSVGCQFSSRPPPGHTSSCHRRRCPGLHAKWLCIRYGCVEMES